MKCFFIGIVSQDLSVSRGGVFPTACSSVVFPDPTVGHSLLVFTVLLDQLRGANSERKLGRRDNGTEQNNHKHCNSKGNSQVARCGSAASASAHGFMTPNSTIAPGVSEHDKREIARNMGLIFYFKQARHTRLRRKP